MADVYEKDLAQKSSLTTSDFIRVVGSDNVSYKQLVTSVLALNGTFYDDAWKANTDLNNFKADGVYWISSSPTNAPTGLTWFPLAVIARSDTVRQIVISSGNVVYTRAFRSNAWGEWVKQPTRAEVDALKINKVSKTFTGITCSAGGYVLLTNYTSLGIERNKIVTANCTTGNYLVMLQYASEGIYLFSHSAISNQTISFTFYCWS